MARVGTCAGKFSSRGVPWRGNADRTTCGCLELTLLCVGGFSCFTNYWWNSAESCSCCSGKHRTTTWGVQVVRYPNFFLGNGSR